MLERAGLIARGREAQWRPCRLEPHALKGVDDWLERYRRLWEERLDRLEGYLRELQAKEHQRRRRSVSARSSSDLGSATRARPWRRGLPTISPH